MQDRMGTRRQTDMADELFGRAAQPPAGVRMVTARTGGVTVTRVQIAARGLRPRGRYVTLEVPACRCLMSATRP
jgi:spore protease